MTRLVALVAIVHPQRPPPARPRGPGALHGRIHRAGGVYPAYKWRGVGSPKRVWTPCGLSLRFDAVEVERFEGYPDEVTCDQCRSWQYEQGELP